MDQPAPPPQPRGDSGQIVIKKYANRRLYNTGSSSYVTLEHLAEMVKQGVDFVVYDARTNDDITRQVLTQIIFEAENSGQNMLPIQFLRQLIKLYGHQVQAFVPGYLEMSLDAFAKQQDTLRDRVGGAVGSGFAKPSFPGGDGYRLFEEQVRQNMLLFDRAMKIFTPFSYVRPEETTGRAAAPPAPPTPSTAPEDGGVETLAEMKSRLDAMQRQIERLAGKG
ncbi:polyhydroxyalkanoate synthesis repressor PhaR [Caulobacter sp. S45]|uniref:polyhydroxyalkanoate synthesis repressor PhaR n=1 Tax=Caulobacter sp. S45 TaxID=1641861 RepID=UPI001574F5D1|nr:polyhydroxyalkanoate synthesis repressor PhaR [Caulobacter sp. S45]